MDSWTNVAVYENVLIHATNYENTKVSTQVILNDAFCSFYAQVLNNSLFHFNSRATQLDIFDHYLKMVMIQRISFLLLLVLVSLCDSLAQDKVLLTNGRIKKLKGNVVYYDYNDIFFQTKAQREKMLIDSAKRAQELQQLRASESWQAQVQGKQQKLEAKKQKQLDRIEAAKTDFEQRKSEMEQKLGAADFEKWKQSQLDQIKKLESRFELYWALQEQKEELKTEREEARFRSRYAGSRSRSNVFSIIHEDGSEEIVYNADTLGLLADGEFESEYGVEDMRLYIKGRQDGRKHSLHDIGIGAAVGLASGLAFTYTLDMFYAPIPPAICVAVIAGLRKMKPSNKLELTAAMLESDPYMDGYYRSAKGRKIFGFTIGAVGGLGIGIGTAVATSPLLQ